MMEDLSKKKVTELKQALKEKGLPTSGTKPDLLKRLSDALGGGDAEVGDPAVDDSLQDIDEDDILNEDPSPVVGTVPTPKVAVAADSATPNGDSTKAATKATSSMPTTTECGDGPAPVKPSEMSKLSDAERLKMRAEKYGVVSAASKKEMRAQRFGLPSSKPGNAVDLDVLKKRAERFGAVVSTSLNKADEAERKRKRAERFGTASVVSTKSSNGFNSSEDEIKKRKRAERFATAT